VAIPADPGDLTVVATAPGRQEFRATVRISEGQQQSVDVPPLAPAGPVAPAVPPRETAERSSPLRPLGVAVGAAGIVALGVGTYFGLHAISKWNDANAVCPASACPDPGGVSLAHDAKSAALAADITLAAGAVALVAGVVLYVLGAPAPSTVGVLTF
jgi:hypothetical protein